VFIGEVSRITGLTKKAIRFYTSSGLISPEVNEENNYMIFSDGDIEKLIKIKFLREMDYSTDKIKKIVNKKLNIEEILEKKKKDLGEQIIMLIERKEMYNDFIINHNNDEFTIIDKFLNWVDKERKLSFENFKNKFFDIFPGNYGKILFMEYGVFLKSIYDARNDNDSWATVVGFLDEYGEIELSPKGYDYFNSVILEEIDECEMKQKNLVDELISKTDEELEEIKRKSASDNFKKKVDTFLNDDYLKHMAEYEKKHRDKVEEILSLNEEQLTQKKEEVTERVKILQSQKEFKQDNEEFLAYFDVMKSNEELFKFHSEFTKLLVRTSDEFRMYMNRNFIISNLDIFYDEQGNLNKI